jgi:DNA-binding transcriptional LysR family regulator
LTLLDRSRGGRHPAGLTPAGRVLAGHAGRLAAVLAEAERDLAELTGQVTGRVVVSAFPTAVAHLVAPAVVALRDSAPHVTVSIRELDPGPALAALRSGELDLVMAETLTTGSGVRLVPLLDDPYYIAAPISWGADVEALLDRPWVDGSPGSAARAALDELARRYGVTLRREHECVEFPVALALVSAGLAAAVVPGLALPSAPVEGVRTLPVPAIGARKIGILHRSARHEPAPAARLMLDAIQRRATEAGHFQ